MHSYQYNRDTEHWTVFFDDGAPDSSPRVLRVFKIEWHAMQLVNMLNGGAMPATQPAWLR